MTVVIKILGLLATLLLRSLNRRISTHLIKYKYKYKYNERFVRRRSTNRPGAPYNNNNKSVRTIKQNSFKSFLEYVSVSNVM